MADRPSARPPWAFLICAQFFRLLEFGTLDAVECVARQECGELKTCPTATASFFRLMKFCRDLLTVGTLGHCRLYCCRDFRDLGSRFSGKPPHSSHSPKHDGPDGSDGGNGQIGQHGPL